MRNTLLCFVFILSAWQLQAQIPTDYFQQETNYNIDVSLDDSLHILSGTVDIEYKNNAPDALSEIYLHIWPNAYRNRQTALSKQMVENGKMDLYFSKSGENGGYKDLDVQVNNKVVEWNYTLEHIDIVKIELSEPLASGESLTINTDFTMKIPNTFSRLGHIDQSYQMTQWYPKPAVYDKNGWHQMPYLDQGEFYSEFGSFDVNITLPKNYVVGATGVLQTDDEKAFLRDKVEETKRLVKLGSLIDQEAIFPASSEEKKTIRYTAENVHDFAWFADKRFYVNQSEIELASGKKVDTYVMFTDKQADKWGKAIDYVNRSVKFYSDKVGEYPYPQATAVQSALSAGAGMEYPMITVIGLSGTDKSLDEVITHEVGHNWFYGILASNERDHAWMDEGFNSYYEKEYMGAYYEDESGSYLGFERIAGAEDKIANQLSFYLPMRRGTAQAIDTKSQDLRPLNYWTSAYDRPALLLEHLENYLGQDKFDQLMQTYYDTWKFKHPQPNDVKALFEKETGKDLSWLFGDLIQTVKPLDYKMKSIKRTATGYELTIENVGEIVAPFPVDVIEEDKLITSKWVEGFQGEKTINISVDGADKFVIDSEYNMPDLHRTNNTITAKGGKIEPFRLKFLTGVENPKKTDLYWLPIVGYNKYDGLMPGLMLHNIGLPSRKLEWFVAPMFGTRSKDIVGFANAKYNIYPKGNIQRITPGIGYKGFTYVENDFYDQFDSGKSFRYHRINPFVEIDLTKKKGNKKQSMKLETLVVMQETTGTLDRVETPTDTFFTYTGHENVMSIVPRFKYRIEGKNDLRAYMLEATLEGHSYKTRPAEENAAYVRTSVEAKYTYNYKDKRGIHVRTFIGAFLYNTQKNAGGVSNIGFARASYSL
ncbi:MAG: M1 family metallopeptidase, partial [Saprospiraceae bacterium]